MSAAALLTVVATILVGKPVPVHCHAPADHPVWGDVVGWTYYSPTRIFLRDCAGVLELERAPADTFAHELLHAKHPFWPHRRVYRLEHRFGAIVLQAVERIEDTIDLDLQLGPDP